MKKNVLRLSFLCIFLFIVFLLWNLVLIPLNLDEVWNYGFSHNIYSGLIPYKDFNMVLTPFYSFIMALPFYLFGSNMLVFHIEQAIYLVILSIMVLYLLKEKGWILLIFLFVPVCISFPSYNIFLFLLFILVLVLEKNRCNDYVIGFILGLLVLTKQSVGVFLLLPSIYYLFSDKKKVIKRIIGFLVPVFIFLIYLIVSKSFYQFFDLCLFGLFDFASTNGKKSFSIWHVIFILMVLVIGYFLYKDRDDLDNYYALGFLSVAIPLFDPYHIQVAFLGVLYLILKRVDKVYIKPRLFGMGVIVGLCIFMSFMRFSREVVYPNDINHFEYRLLEKENILLTKDVLKLVREVEDKGREVVYLNSNGYYFRIINDERISYIDLINSGNLGYNGSLKLLDLVKKKKNAVFIVDKSELSPIKQTDKNVLNYVIDNGKKISSISFFDVYVLE